MRVIVVGGGIAGLSVAIGLRGKSEEGRLTESWGVGERFGLVDIGHGRTYWFATKNALEREADEPEGRKAELTRRFSSWHAPISSSIEATGENESLRNDVYYLEPLPRWSVGSITLMGDAAHATTPGIGQGAAQAIEDAVVLADRLTNGPSGLATSQQPRPTDARAGSVPRARTDRLRRAVTSRRRVKRQPHATRR